LNEILKICVDRREAIEIDEYFKCTPSVVPLYGYDINFKHVETCAKVKTSNQSTLIICKSYRPTVSIRFVILRPFVMQRLYMQV